MKFPRNKKRPNEKHNERKFNLKLYQLYFFSYVHFINLIASLLNENVYSIYKLSCGLHSSRVLFYLSISILRCHPFCPQTTHLVERMLIVRVFFFRIIMSFPFAVVHVRCTLKPLPHSLF